MAMGRTFKEALMKAWRALETGKKTGAEVLERAPPHAKTGHAPA